MLFHPTQSADETHQQCGNGVRGDHALSLQNTNPLIFLRLALAVIKILFCQYNTLFLHIK